MRAERTRYEVAGWGVGELWTVGDVVLAHDFAFDPVSDTGAALRSATSDGDLHRLNKPGTREPRKADPSSCGSFDSNSAHVSLDRSRCLTPSELAARLSAFLAGEPVVLDHVRLDLGSGTPFQRAIATTLRAIPRGEVVTYGELAAIAGYPAAQRAVGTFCARNRFMFLLPCHRVVGSAGIGGYGSAGVRVKRRLLALEGVSL